MLESYLKKKMESGLLGVSQSKDKCWTLNIIQVLNVNMFLHFLL